MICIRVVPPVESRLRRPTLVVTMAVELSRRRSSGGESWATALWAKVAPELAGAIRVKPGPAGSIVVAWSLERADPVASVAEHALALLARLAPDLRQNLELRGGIALGVADVGQGSDPVERSAERLALAASPGQWLISEEVARQLQERFQLGGAGMVPRWPMPFVGGHRTLIGRLAPPALPSAVSGEPPETLLGRAGERRCLVAEIAQTVAGRRRVVLVTGPAGGGKSYLLRRVLADGAIKLAAGVAFPPLGSHPLGPLRAMLARLGETDEGDAGERLGAALGEAATRQASIEPSAVVVDDVHWATPEAIATLRHAISATPRDAPLAWILSTRKTALPRLGALTELADVRVELPPLDPDDRVTLLAHRLGGVPRALRNHVARDAQRGNPLYLEHLAEAIREGCAEDALPRTLHEAILARLDGLVVRARELSHWSNRSLRQGTPPEALERELGDWLDRLETSDTAHLTTIGRYLARLRAADFELVLARSLLGMPVSPNRRVAWAVERLAAVSSDALLDYLEGLAGDGRRTEAAHEARSEADRAERALRMDDAERLLSFAARHDPSPEIARKRGDLALTLGRPRDALLAYRDAASASDPTGELDRRIARAQALAGEVAQAASRLEELAARADLEPATTYAAGLDLARLRGMPPPRGKLPACPATERRTARTRAWARAGEPEAAHEVLPSLVLDGAPAACAAELIETAALARFAGLRVDGLAGAATVAAGRLGNPRAVSQLKALGPVEGRRTFLHWDV